MTVGLLAESVMLMLAMSRSPGSAFVVAIDISLRAEFIVSSRIVLDWTESMVVSSMPFGAALVISTAGMLVLPVAAWDGWMLMVSGISGSGFLLSFGVSSRMMPSQSLVLVEWSDPMRLIGCRMARPVVAIVAAFASTNAEIFRCSFVEMVGMSKWLKML